MKIGKRISYLREQLNLNQKDLANKIGVNISVMNRIESGERQLRDIEIISISQVLNVTTDYLLGVSDSKKSTCEKTLSNKSLQEWYDDLVYSDESELHRLHDIWEIMNRK